MSDAFDPYYIWLGIPPEEQPPHHYRLLGVTLFENNREVIEAAANRQMAYMQEVSAGEAHIDEAQKILGELSRARVCLLSDEKKEAYDTELRASFDTLDEAGGSAAKSAADSSTESTAADAPTAPGAPGAPGAPAKPKPAQKKAADDGPLMPPQFGKTGKQSESATGAPQLGQTAKHSQKSSKPKKKKQSSSLLVGLLISVLVVLLITGAVLFKSSENAKKEAARQAAIARKATERKAQEEADRKAAAEREKQAEADRKAKEDADRKAKEDADRKAKEDADRKAKEDADRKAKAEADRKAKEDADRKAKEDADRKAKEDADRKAKEDADRKAKEEADRKAKKKAEAASQAEADKRKARAVGILTEKGIILRDGLWEPKDLWEKYRQKETEIKRIKTAFTKKLPIPKSNSIAELKRLRTSYDKQLQDKFNEVAADLYDENLKKIVFIGDAKDKLFWELYPHQREVRMGNEPLASEEDRLAKFYKTIYPRYMNLFITNPNIYLRKNVTQLNRMKRKIKLKNQALMNDPKISQALSELGESLNGAPE